MSDGFRAGDLVECVDGKFYRRNRWMGQAPPTSGLIYTVAGIDEDGDVHLRELPTIDGVAFFKWRFRKIHRPRAEFLTELLTAPVDIKEHEHA